jgi:hypothetical protein
MPTSIDPPLAEDEIECARCRARFHYELTRCPNCGVNLYEPDESSDPSGIQQSGFPSGHPNSLGVRLEGFFRRFSGKPYKVDRLFGAGINQAELFENLLVKVGGDRAAAERLIAFEQSQDSQGNRIRWLERAIRRWERDNRSPGSN